MSDVSQIATGGDYPAQAPGQLTPEQQRQLSAVIGAEATPGLVGAGCFVFLFGVILLAGRQSYNSALDWQGQAIFGAGIALSLAVMVYFLARRQRALAEVRAGRLQRATGHIVWQGRGYRAEVPGHTLNLNDFNLAAGTYTFSFLPSSGWVVSAELVAADGPEQARDQLRHVLAVTNHFNLDDLPAFRQGQLGPGRSRLLRQAWTPPVLWLGAALVLLLTFVALVAAHTATDVAPALFVFAAFAGIAGLLSAVTTLRETGDLLQGKLSTVTGEVTTSIRRTYGKGANTFYYYHLDQHVWSVAPQAYHALLAGQSYRVYYLPSSHILMGIEPE
jgi:hypothetical protein